MTNIGRFKDQGIDGEKERSVTRTHKQKDDMEGPVIWTKEIEAHMKK